MLNDPNFRMRAFLNGVSLPAPKKPKRRGPVSKLKAALYLHRVRRQASKPKRHKK